MPHPGGIDPELSIEGFQSKLLLQLFDAAAGSVAAETLESCEEFQVLPARQGPIEAALVRGHEAHQLDRTVRFVYHIHALDGDPPSGRQDECGKDLEQRRLAGPVGSQQAENFASPNGEVDVAEYTNR